MSLGARYYYFKKYDKNVDDNDSKGDDNQDKWEKICMECKMKCDWYGIKYGNNNINNNGGNTIK